MEDNNHNPWPREPRPALSDKAKNPADRTAGKVSLGMAVAAVLATLALPYILFRSLDFTIQRLCVLGYMAWWAVAVVLGIIGRRSTSGKIALVILLFLGMVIVWIGLQHPPQY